MTLFAIGEIAIFVESKLKGACPSEIASASPILSNASASIANDVRAGGFAFVSGDAVTGMLSARALTAWAAFAASWDDLCIDDYMADGARYRRRRHASFTMTGERIAMNPRRPHFQSRVYNRLNGGVDRWFDLVTPKVAGGVLMSEIIAICRSIFQQSQHDRALQNGLLEMHQFRIEPDALGNAKPTPEGMHRDGVDWVCILLINRTNVENGVTIIEDTKGRHLGSTLLQHCFDAVFIDDRRVAHGVTPVCRIDPMRAAHRDVLVLTFDGR